MKISVITVCFNSAKTIERTLESFVSQKNVDKELVVIDGGSTDQTLQIVEKCCAENVRVISEPDGGIYDAMNKGLRVFGGDAVGFLNSDDRFKDPDVLSYIAEGLAEGDIVFGDLDIVTSLSNGRIVRKWRATPWAKGAFNRGWMPAHPTFYCRRRVVEAVGEFDLRYKIGADYDYMLRAMELHKFASVRLPKVLVEMLHGGESSSTLRSHIKHNIEASRSRRRWLGTGVVDFALFAKPLRKLPQLFSGVRP